MIVLDKTYIISNVLISKKSGLAGFLNLIIGHIKYTYNNTKCKE